MRYIKEILKKKTMLIILPILLLLIVALIAIGITNAANNATEPETEQTFTEEGDGYYIWVRAVDHAGNKGPWSEAQRVWIDSKPPIVTCTETNNTLTITEGDVVTLADYFTVDPNGKNTNITKTCTINGTNYTTTDGITEGTYTVTCTAAKESGLSADATMTLVVEAGWKVGVSLSAADVAANPELYSGIEIKGYTCTNSAGVNAWKIFYADSSNIYLIADNYIHYDYTPADRNGTKPDGSGYKMYFSSIYSHYDGSANILDTSITDSRIQKWIDYASYKSTAANANIKSVAYMLDCNVWKVYKDNTYAAYAIGGPTVELFADAYDWAHPGTDIGYDHKFDYGYKVGTGGTATAYDISGLNTSDSTYVISAPDRADGYWLASPSAINRNNLVRVGYIGYLRNSGYDYIHLGFRPLVCLKEGVTLETIEGGKAKVMLPDVTTATSIQSATTEYQDAKGNKIVVPGGFKVRTDLATTVDKGIVIEDSSGNQFVWIPIGTITKADGSTVTIDLGRYTFNTSNGTPTIKQAASAYTSTVRLPDSYYLIYEGTTKSYIAELTTSRVGSSSTNATAINLAEFISKTTSNKGFYIARYEASSSSTGNSKSGVAPTTNITQPNASKAARAMYNGNSYVVSDLVNSYMWDTAIVFIQKCSSSTNYANKIDESGSYYNTGASSDVVCNIYDMSGNVSEWGTENSSEDGCPCVLRGGPYSTDDYPRGYG